MLHIPTTTLKFNSNGGITKGILVSADVKRVFIFSVGKVIVPYLKLWLLLLDTQKFISLHLDNHLMWKPHIDFLLCIRYFIQQTFDAQFYKLSYTYWLAIPMHFEAQGINFRESTI